MLVHKLMGASDSAPVYVGGLTFAGVGTTSVQTISLTGLQGGIASSPSTGDYIVVAYAVGSQGTSAVPLDVDFAVLQTMTQIRSISYTSTTYDSTLLVKGAFLPAGYNSFRISGSGSTSNARAVAVHVWRNVNIFQPLDATATTERAGGSDTTITTPSITTITASAVVIAVGAVANPSTVTITSSMDNLQAVASSDTVCASVGMASAINYASGAYNPPNFSLSSLGSGSSQTAVTLALRSK